MNSASGRCLCGAISFRAKLPSKWVAHCHCTLCQRSSGAGFVTWVGLESEHAEVVDPQFRLVWFRSSERGERGFCSHCGSTIFFRSPRWPGELHVTLANFDEPIDRSPQAHVFWDSHVEWLACADDGLPRKTSSEIG